MRTGLTGASCSSDIVQIDPNNGILLSRFKCEAGETARCIQIAKIGNEQVLIVGTSKSTDRPMMPNGEAERFTSHLFFIKVAIAVLVIIYLFTSGLSVCFPFFLLSSFLGLVRIGKAHVILYKLYCCTRASHHRHFL